MVYGYWGPGPPLGSAIVAAAFQAALFCVINPKDTATIRRHADNGNEPESDSHFYNHSLSKSESDFGPHAVLRSV